MGVMKSLKSVSGDATYQNNIQFYILYIFKYNGHSYNWAYDGKTMGITVFFQGLWRNSKD